MAVLQVTYVEDDRAQFKKFAPLLRELFASDLYEVEIRHFAAEQEFRKFIAKADPHVVIVDLKLQTSDFEGMRIIARTKTRLPSTVCCLLSREKIVLSQFGVHTPNPDFIISKVTLGGKDDDYMSYVRKAVLGRIRRSFIETLSYAEDFEGMFGQLVSRDSDRRHIQEFEVRSIIEQVTFAGHVTNPSNQYSEVKLELLPGGYSKAVVLRVLVNRNGFSNIVGVAKVSPIEDAEEEFSNYNKFVKWTLPYTWRAEVMGTARTGSFGAVCYSFVFDGHGIPRSVTDFLRDGDVAIVAEIGRTIFNPSKRTWYASRRDTGRDLSDYFSSPPYFRNAKQMDSRELCFITRLSEVFVEETIEAKDDKIVVGEETFLRPMRLLFSNEWGKVVETICHGDMNSNNVLYEPISKIVAFIDFQRTGFFHVFRDFVSLESSIRLEWKEGSETFMFRELLKEELCASPDRAERVQIPYIQQCVEVRRKAIENFEDIDFRQYYFALAIHCWWLATRFDGWSLLGFRRLCVGALASLRKLEGEFPG